MNGMASKTTHFAFVHAGWSACILGAAGGIPLAGVVFVLVWVSIHIALTKDRKNEILFILAAAVFGYLADSFLVLAGLLVFPPGTRLGSPSTIWMVALWVNFAAVVGPLLSWIRGRYLLAALLGGVGGPLAYWGGAGLGAAILAEPYLLTLLAVAVEYVIAVPFLVYLHARLHKAPPGREREAAQVKGDRA